MMSSPCSSSSQLFVETAAKKGFSTIQTQPLYLLKRSGELISSSLSTKGTIATTDVIDLASTTRNPEVVKGLDTQSVLCDCESSSGSGFEYVETMAKACNGGKRLDVK